jgi:predicted DNA-binding transcriptional regulator AlpA
MVEREEKVLTKVLDYSNDQLLIDVKEVASYLGVGPATVFNWRWKGIFPLPTIKIGRKVLVRAVDLAAFLAGTSDFSIGKPSPAPVLSLPKKRGRPPKLKIAR